MPSDAHDADVILREVGGRENVTRLTHCFVRLRFRLRDPAAADIDALRAHPLVAFTAWQADELHIAPRICGTCSATPPFPDTPPGNFHPSPWQPARGRPARPRRVPLATRGQAPRFGLRSSMHCRAVASNGGECQ